MRYVNGVAAEVQLHSPLQFDVSFAREMINACKSVHRFEVHLVITVMSHYYYSRRRSDGSFGPWERLDQLKVLSQGHRLISNHLHDRVQHRLAIDAARNDETTIFTLPIFPPRPASMAEMDKYARWYRYILLLLCRFRYYGGDDPGRDRDRCDDCGFGRIIWPWSATEPEPEFDIIRAIAQPGADDVFWHMTRYLAD